MSLDAETESNFEKFFVSWTNQAQENWTNLAKNDHYLRSYRRIASFNAIRTDLLYDQVTSESHLFFQEAQNDLLVSHVNASFGSWRTSLQALRAHIENVLCGLYYMDHPVELANWGRGKHKLGFRQLHKYFESHPDLQSSPLSKKLLEKMEAEYATLSKAVHGSAKNFRMTEKASDTLLWSVEESKIGMWEAREKAVMFSTVLLILVLFSDSLTGTKRPGLRKSLVYLFSDKTRRDIKSELKVSIT